jgi:hypothetical protein
MVAAQNLPHADAANTAAVDVDGVGVVGGVGKRCNPLAALYAKEMKSMSSTPKAGDADDGGASTRFVYAGQTEQQMNALSPAFRHPIEFAYEFYAHSTVDLTHPDAAAAEGHLLRVCIFNGGENGDESGSADIIGSALLSTRDLLLPPFAKMSEVSQPHEWRVPLAHAGAVDSILHVRCASVEIVDLQANSDAAEAAAAVASASMTASGSDTEWTDSEGSPVKSRRMSKVTEAKTSPNRKVPPRLIYRF